MVERHRRYQSRSIEPCSGPSPLAAVAQGTHETNTTTEKGEEMIYLIFVLAVLTRFISNAHVPEFSPIFGALLFSGARLKKRDAVWFPVTALAVCDWFLTVRVFHMEMKWQYSITLVAFAAMAWIGGLLRQKVTVARFGGR